VTCWIINVSWNSVLYSKAKQFHAFKKPAKNHTTKSKKKKVNGRKRQLNSVVKCGSFFPCPICKGRRLDFFSRLPWMLSGQSLCSSVQCPMMTRSIAVRLMTGRRKKKLCGWGGYPVACHDHRGIPRIWVSDTNSLCFVERAAVANVFLFSVKFSKFLLLRTGTWTSCKTAALLWLHSERHVSTAKTSAERIFDTLLTFALRKWHTLVSSIANSLIWDHKNAKKKLKFVKNCKNM